MKSSLHPAAPALAAALLFGVSTPLAKLLSGSASPLLLAGLLYVGSGVGLCAVIVFRSLLGANGAGIGQLGVPRNDLPWLIGAVVTGGMLGPALLMAGLTVTSAASASLLLNVEGVLTATIAWLVFRENADRQIVLGMLAIVAGGVLLSWEPSGAGVSPGALLIIGACLCWAIDNNLTRKVSSNDALFIAGTKGLVAGACNSAIALSAGAAVPSPSVIVAVLATGFVGYGLSLTLFVVGLRTLGAARAGAYFSVAPLFGVAVSLVLWPQVPDALFWLAAALMGLGIWLHLRERHEHEHVHEPLTHRHWHWHDEHHQHGHGAGWDGSEPHAHEHCHQRLVHKHPHYPDIHHQHVH